MEFAFFIGLLVLLALFLLLTHIERTRGTRFFEASRRVLDTRVAELEAQYRDPHTFSTMVRGVRHLGSAVLHEIGHTLLALVRVLERALVRLLHPKERGR